MFHSRFLASAAVSALLLGAAPVLTYAQTPPDTLIQAWSIDDIITLDPAEIFEFTASEIAGNTYETLIGYNPEDVSDIFGKAAESWTVSEDGKTIHFKMREGRKFASGNPITAADAVFSLVRAVKLDKSPAFIIGQAWLHSRQCRAEHQANRRIHVRFHDGQALCDDAGAVLSDRNRGLGRG